MSVLSEDQIAAAAFDTAMAARRAAPSRVTNQKLISAWVVRNWGRAYLHSLVERASRVLEEAVELAQACGVTQDLARRIVDRVYSRPAGDPQQEMAGVGTTLMGCAEAMGVELDEVENREIDRVTSLPVEHFRQKYNEKAADGVVSTPSDTALPEVVQ
jgi:hypothetical protein